MNVYAWILIAVIVLCSLGFVIYMVGWAAGYNRCVEDCKSQMDQVGVDKT